MKTTCKFMLSLKKKTSLSFFCSYYRLFSDPLVRQIEKAYSRRSARSIAIKREVMAVVCLRKCLSPARSRTWCKKQTVRLNVVIDLAFLTNWLTYYDVRKSLLRSRDDTTISFDLVLPYINSNANSLSQSPSTYSIIFWTLNISTDSQKYLNVILSLSFWDMADVLNALLCSSISFYHGCISPSIADRVFFHGRPYRQFFLKRCSFKQRSEF